MLRILVVADLKGLAYNREARRFISGKIEGACLRNNVPIKGDKEVFIENIARANGVKLSQIAYFGSYAWRDLDALRKVQAGGGLVVCFNSAAELLNVAPIALWTRSAWPVALLVAIFAKWGKTSVFEAVLMSDELHDIAHLMLPHDWEEEIATGLSRNSFSFQWSLCSVKL